MENNSNLNSRLANLVKTFMPPPRSGINDDNYEGVEYKWKSFRLRPSEFKYDGLMILCVLIYILWSFLGTKLNKRIADKWASEWRKEINSQLAIVSNFKSNSLTYSDGPTDYLTYGTGRRGLNKFYTYVHTRPRHDVIRQIFNLAWSTIDFSSDVSDNVTLDVKIPFPSGVSQDVGFVYSIIKKSKMSNLRKQRFDLTLTKVISESNKNNGIPIDFCVMSELHSLNDIFSKTNLSGIPEVLKESGQYLNWLVISDQPSEKPSKGPLKPEEKERSITFNLKLPSDVSKLNPYIKLIFNIVDLIHFQKLNINPDSIRRLNKNRIDVDNVLAKEYARQLEEENEDNGTAETKASDRKKALKKQIEDEKYNKMTPDQRRKFEEKERKKNLKRSQPKAKR